MKTGLADQMYAAPQLGIYAWLAKQEGRMDEWIHALSVKRGKERQPAEFISLPFKRMAEEGWLMIQHFVRMVESEFIAIPGTHCGDCRHETCVYRIEEDGGE